MPLRILGRAKPRTIHVTVHCLQAVRVQARLLRLGRARHQPGLQLHRHQPLPLRQSAARRHLVRLRLRLRLRLRVMVGVMVGVIVRVMVGVMVGVIVGVMVGVMVRVSRSTPPAARVHR